MYHDVALARGLVDSTGARHRRVRLRPPTGHVELGLAGRRADAPGPDDADELLAGCVARIGEFHDVTPSLTAALTRGDRARLALAIRTLLHGDAILLIVECPAAGCGALADLTLRTHELLGETRTAQALSIAVSTADGDVEVRPPTGADDRAAAGADDELWGRLVSRAGQPIGAAGWHRLAPTSHQQIAMALSGLDSCADLAFVCACPRCGCWIELELDAVDLLTRTLATGEHRLLAEVHCLAFHYGWPESDILALPRPRRFAYLELLCDQLEGRPLTRAGA
ncbi:hypothetical protein MMAG44476_04037 [Mycolicibacterium mageritense DSM 44476 = CIP 104973]|uniref:Uncharacterized protein n=1 Tax=Mycolicibacterium mageritense TaxID=53462 RepID=A0AAI8TU84_MYCME|nr:hypothetical protein [Mycolicibacterium mageritense]BBX36213.1 hypothetical protein MMAGJ_54950 [Mycolicibacterium mageritense]BDY31038.1 hypothetical protein hbim_04990 [Mycolicibacterium mageritense]